MLQSFPAHEWITRLNPKDEMPASTPELTSGVFRYLAIVHFAFVLHELRYLSNDLWKLLQAEHTEHSQLRYLCGSGASYLDNLDGLRFLCQQNGLVHALVL